MSLSPSLSVSNSHCSKQHSQPGEPRRTALQLRPQSWSSHGFSSSESKHVQDGESMNIIRNLLFSITTHRLTFNQHRVKKMARMKQDCLQYELLQSFQLSVLALSFPPQCLPFLSLPFSIWLSQISSFICSIPCLASCMMSVFAAEAQHANTWRVKGSSCRLTAVTEPQERHSSPDVPHSHITNEQHRKSRSHHQNKPFYRQHLPLHPLLQMDDAAAAAVETTETWRPTIAPRYTTRIHGSPQIIRLALAKIRVRFVYGPD